MLVLNHPPARELDAEQSLAGTRRELEEAHQDAQRCAADFEAAKQKHRKAAETAARSTSQLESKCADAEDHAMEAETALAAFGGRA